MARESGLWRWLSGARRVLGADLHMTRVENLIGSGMPDVEGCYQGTQFWLELKSAMRPVRSATPVRFPTKGREEQASWAISRIAAGGRVGYLLQVGHGHSRTIYLCPGRYVPLLHAGATEAKIADWSRIIKKPDEAILQACGVTER